MLPVTKPATLEPLDVSPIHCGAGGAKGAGVSRRPRAEAMPLPMAIVMALNMPAPLQGGAPVR